MICQYQVGAEVLSVRSSQIDDKPGTSIADTTAWTGPRTLDHLVEFIVKGEEI